MADFQEKASAALLLANREHPDALLAGKITEVLLPFIKNVGVIAATHFAEVSHRDVVGLVREGYLSLIAALRNQGKLGIKYKATAASLLAVACSGGRLDVARWLAEKFGLTAEDARANNNYALLSSSGK